MEPKKNLPKLKMEPIMPREEPFPRQARREYSYPRPRPVYMRRGVSASRKRAGMGGFALQCLASAMVFVMVLLLQRMDVPVGQGLLEGLSFVISQDGQGAAEIPEGWLAEAITVFSGSSPVSTLQPAAGEGIREANGMTLYNSAGEIRTILDGVVFYAGEREDGTPYVRLRHSGGFESWYEGAQLDVRAGQELQSGDVVGSLGEGESVRFCLKHEGIIVDHEKLGGGS